MHRFLVLGLKRTFMQKVIWHLVIVAMHSFLVLGLKHTCCRFLRGISHRVAMHRFLVLGFKQRSREKGTTTLF